MYKHDVTHIVKKKKEMDNSLREYAKLANKLIPPAPRLPGVPGGKLPTLEFLIQVHEIAKLCRHHLIDNSGRVLDLTARWKPLYTQFIYYFDEYNLEKESIATTDHVFIVDCRVRCCANPALATRICRNDFKQLSMRLRILSCQHTKESRVPINLSEVEILHNEVAAYVSSFILLPTNHSAMVALAKNSECNNADLRDVYYKLQFSSDALRRENEVIKAKARIALEHDPAELLKLLVDSGDDDVNRGLMFQEKPECEIRAFVVIAVRLFRCIELERMLLEMHPTCTQTFHIEQARYTALQKWFNNQCDIELGAAFGTDFQRIALEYLFPIGARLDTNRYMISQGEIEPIDNVASTQLGYNVTQMLRTDIGQSYKSICCQPENILYDFLLMKNIQYIFTTRLRLANNQEFDFLKSYIILRKIYMQIQLETYQHCLINVNTYIQHDH
jgi:hypothetical protein